jgi:outer membrane protein, heavy metal efflux system
MAALLRTALVALTSVVALGCYSPQRTSGANEAVAIYQRSARANAAPAFRGRSASDRGAAVPDVASGAPLTVDNAIAIAKKNSAKLAELDARVAAADAGIDAAGQRRNPELRVTSVRLGRTNEDLNVVTPRLRFKPERPGEIGAREAEARAERDELEAHVHAEEMAIETEIRWFFDDVVVLDAEIAASERAAATRGKIAAQVKNDVGAATATGIDSDLADLFALEADGDVAELRSRRALLVTALLDRLGAPKDTKLVLAGDASAWPPPPLPSEQVLVEHALRRSPRVAGSAARIDGANARLHREEARRWPWLEFFEVGYEITKSPTGVPLFTVGAGVELPIFSTNGGGVRHAEASKAAAAHQLEAEVEKTTREIRQRVREVEAAAALVTEFRQKSLPLLERARADMERALAASSINMVRALTIEERINLVEVKLFKLVRRHRTSLDGLRRAIGGPIPSGG